MGMGRTLIQRLDIIILLELRRLDMITGIFKSLDYSHRESIMNKKYRLTKSQIQLINKFVKNSLTNGEIQKINEFISKLQPKYQKQFNAKLLKSILQKAEEYKKPFFFLLWLKLYIGCTEDTSKEVIAQIYNEYPEFRNMIKQMKMSYPKDGKRFNRGDYDLFNDWEGENTVRDEPWAAIIFMTSGREELRAYFIWILNQKRPYFGFDFIPFNDWVNQFKNPAAKVLIEIEGDRDKLIPRKKELQSITQYLFERDENIINAFLGSEPAPKLSKKTKKEIELHDFESQLKIVVTGKTPCQSINIVRVEDVDVRVGDVPFLLLLRLMLQLTQKDSDGYVYKIDLVDEGFLTPSNPDQGISRLRDPFRAALKGLDPQKFIQVHEKQVRLSTHPSFISVKKKKLMKNHPDARVMKLVEQLPESSRIK